MIEHALIASFLCMHAPNIMMLHYHPNNELAKHKELFFHEVDVYSDPEAVIYVDLKSPWCVASSGYYAGFYNEKTQEVQIFRLMGMSKRLIDFVDDGGQVIPIEDVVVERGNQRRPMMNPFEPFSCVRAHVEMRFVETLEVDRIEPEAYRKLVRRKPE